MPENLAYNIEDLFKEVVDAGRVQGVVDQEAYHGLVDEVVEEHRGLAEIHDDEPTTGIATQLKARWEEYREAVGA